MINYFIELFTKPQYQWSVLDKLATAGLIIGVCIILVAIWLVIFSITYKIKKRKYKKCEKRINGIFCHHYNDCLGCKFYKKREDNKDVKN